MVFCIFKIATTKHTVIEYIVIALFLGLGGLVYYCSGEKGLLIYFTMMLGMKAVEKTKVIKLGLAILSISFSVLFLLNIVPPFYFGGHTEKEINHVPVKSPDLCHPQRAAF